MAKVVTLEQLENQTRRMKSTLDTKPDKSETLCNVQEKSDGIAFTDGNDNVVYKIPVMKET